MVLTFYKVLAPVRHIRLFEQPPWNRIVHNSNSKSLIPMMRVWKISLVLLVFAVEGCKKPPPPKVGVEKNESASPSEHRVPKSARPSESAPIAKAQGSNAPRLGKQEKTAAD